jgi:hypothetical protein
MFEIYSENRSDASHPMFLFSGETDGDGNASGGGD